MKNRWLAALLLLVLAGVSPAFAQGGAGSTGSIQGEVTDESGAVLPGVTVTVSGTSMIGARVDTTNAQGIYRFLGVPAGTYTIKFELSGFGPITKNDIRIGIGFTGTVNGKLSVKNMSETVDVTSAAPTIDATSTRSQTNYGKDQLDALPNARDMWSLLSTTPGIQLSRFDVGGNTAGTQGTYIAYGNGGQNRPLIEGINTTEGTSASGFYFDYGSFDEVIVGAAANTAEMPSGGVMTNFVGKAGGNKLSGEVYYEKEFDDLQSTNLTQDQLNKGAANFAARAIQTLGLKRNLGNTLIDYKNLNASVGGPLIKDKLWAWAGILRQENVTYQPPAGAILDGTPFRTKLMNYTGKLTYQMTPKDRFVAYTQYGIKQQPNRLDSAAGVSLHQTQGSTVLQDSPSWVGKVEYNRTIGNRGFLEVRAGEFGYNFGQTSNGNDPRIEDTSTTLVTGGGRQWELDRRRKQASGSYTFYKDSLLGGNHQFKIGGEIQHEIGEYLIPKAWGNVVSILNNGVAASVRLYAPVDSLNGLDNQGLYVNDSYSRGRFTANLGVRYDHYLSFLPAQERAPSAFDPTGVKVAAVDEVKAFTHFAPRIGLIYDISGNGKTVVKANYGRFYFNLGVGFAEAVNPNSPGPGSNGPYRQYAWTDRNSNGRWDSGEEGALTSNQLSTNGVFDPATAFAPGLKNSYTDEMSFWLERELPGNIGAKLGYVWKMDRDGYQLENIARPRSGFTTPVNVTDIGKDGVAGTGDDKTVSALNFNGPIATTNLLANPDGYTADYKTVELALNRRFSNKFSLVADFTLTNTAEWTTSYFGTGSWGNAGSSGSLFSGFGGAGFPVSPNDQKTQTDFWAYNFRAFGTYEPGWGLRITPTIKIQQGYPYARGFSATLNYGTQAFQGDAFGTYRMDTIKDLDIRFDKRFKVTGRVNLSVLFDVYNVFNANTVIQSLHGTGLTTINETNARVPTFGVPTTILPPRIARISARLSW